MKKDWRDFYHLLLLYWGNDGAEWEISFGCWKNIEPFMERKSCDFDARGECKPLVEGNYFWGLLTSFWDCNFCSERRRNSSRKFIEMHRKVSSDFFHVFPFLNSPSSESICLEHRLLFINTSKRKFPACYCRSTNNNDIIFLSSCYKRKMIKKRKQFIQKIVNSL